MERSWGHLAIVVLLLGALSGIGAYVGSRFMESNSDSVSNVEDVDQNQNMLGSQNLVSAMSLEQKVAQLFIISPEAITGVGVQTAAGDATREAMQQYPVGGFIFFGDNMGSPTQVRDMLTNMQDYSQSISGLPLFLCIDEEGGTVSRIGGNEAFGIDNVGNMADIGATGDVSEARAAASTIGRYLHELGLNVNFAPVADIANNPDATTMQLRSFSSDESVVTAMVRAQVEGFLSTNTLCAAKHFPGIGGVMGDSETGYIVSDKTLDEMAQEELKPFRAAMEANVPFIMVGHLSCPSITGSDIPASLSPEIVTDVLRNNLGYKGIIITDSLSMGAVTGIYSSQEIGVQALLAGNDMILMPDDFVAAYNGVLDAVHDGRISEDRINESVQRIVDAKQSL